MLSRSLIGVLAALLLCVGCQKGAGPQPKMKPQVPIAEGKAGEHDHDHGDGFLFADPNEKYHLRVFFDLGKKEVEVKVLDHIAKDSVPLPADTMTLTIKNGKPHQVTLKAERPEGKKETAHFHGTDDRFATKIDLAKIEISVDIAKKSYIFTLDTEHEKKK